MRNINPYQLNVELFVTGRKNQGIPASHRNNLALIPGGSFLRAAERAAAQHESE